MDTTLRAVRRLAVTAAGIVVVLVGLALLVLPGPGILVTLMGVGILATEYEIFRALLQRLRARARTVVHRDRA